MTGSFIDLGWYRRPDGRRSLLTWWTDGAVTLDGGGDAQLLGYVATEERAGEIFKGWADEPERPVSWVHARMLAADADGLLSCPDCGGVGRSTFRDPFLPGRLIDAACPTCAAVTT